MRQPFFTNELVALASFPYSQGLPYLDRSLIGDPR